MATTLAKPEMVEFDEGDDVFEDHRSRLQADLLHDLR